MRTTILIVLLLSTALVPLAAAVPTVDPVATYDREAAYLQCAAAAGDDALAQCGPPPTSLRG